MIMIVNRDRWRWKWRDQVGEGWTEEESTGRDDLTLRDLRVMQKPRLVENCWNMRLALVQNPTN